jgi:predicted DNA-binding protein
MRTVMSISLPQSTAEELDRYARQTGRNKSDIVKESISLYLWETRFRQVKSGLSRKAKKIGIVTNEDVFKAIS